MLDWLLRRNGNASASTSSIDKDARAWLVDAFLGRKTAAGVYMNPTAALSLSAYYAAIRNISEDCGKLPLFVYRAREPRGRDKLFDHPVYRLLHDEPNEEMTAMAFRETLTHYALGWGNGYAEIVRDRAGRPVSLFPIHPSRVYPARVEGEIIYDVVIDDILSINGLGSSTRRERVRLAAADMLHIHALSGEGIMGYSIATLARESLAMSQEAERFGATFFGNGALAGGVLEHPQKLEDKAYARIRESWNQMHQGAGNAHKVAILEEGMKYNKVGIPPNDAQFLETREFQTEEIARWFRIPPHKIGSLKRSTFSNIEHQSIEYVNDALMPWLVRWEQEIDRKLFTPSERPVLYAEHNVTALLRGDSAQRSTFYREQFNIGVLSPNDIRDLENMNPIGPEGDKYYIQSAMTTLDAVADGRNIAPQPEEPTGNGEEDVDDGPADDDFEAKIRMVTPFVVASAARICRKESMAFARAAEKKPDAGAISAWAGKFYDDQKRYMVAEMMPLVLSLGIECDENLRGAIAELCHAMEAQAIMGSIPPEDDRVRTVSAAVIEFARREIQQCTT